MWVRGWSETGGTISDGAAAPRTLFLGLNGAVPRTASATADLSWAIFLRSLRELAQARSVLRLGRQCAG